MSSWTPTLEGAMDRYHAAAERAARATERAQHYQALLGARKGEISALRRESQMLRAEVRRLTTELECSEYRRRTGGVTHCSGDGFGGFGGGTIVTIRDGDT